MLWRCLRWVHVWKQKNSLFKHLSFPMVIDIAWRKYPYMRSGKRMWLGSRSFKCSALRRPIQSLLAGKGQRNPYGNQNESELQLQIHSNLPHTLTCRVSFTYHIVSSRKLAPNQIRQSRIIITIGCKHKLITLNFSSLTFEAYSACHRLL